MSDPADRAPELPRCALCGDPIEDEQQAIRLAVGVGRPEGFSHLLLREDAYLHAGRPDPNPWTEAPSNERWCATPEGFEKALWTLYLHGSTGASGGRYAGE